MNQRKLYQWVGTISKAWTGVTLHFRENVRVFSGAVVRSQSSQLRKIAGAAGGKVQVESQRRRLQRFVKQEQPLTAFFQGWTSSVVKALRRQEKKESQQVIVLVVDETKLKAALGVMGVGLVYEGRCIPLAWRVYRANSRTDYPAEGQTQMILSLLEQVRAGLPAAVGQRVRVLADRGIGTSAQLMRGVLKLGWTFLFRVTKQSKIVLADSRCVTFFEQVRQPSQQHQVIRSTHVD